MFAALVILCSLSTYAQDSDNQEFWFVAPDASFSHNDRPTFFMITTGDTPASVTISMPANKSFKKITKNIPANSYWKYSFSNDAEISLIENDINSSGIPTQKGFYITSSAPVSAYYQIDGDRNYQKEIFTLKGKKALGTEFYMPFQKAYPISDRDEYNNEQFRQIQIVATKNGTNVVISPKSDQALFKAADGAINSKSPLESRTITLNEGETLLWRENARHTPDLIGTKITSTDKEKPIAVTLFEDCVQDGKDGSVDPIGDQLVPTHNLGKNYIVVKGYSSGNATDHAVILAVATGKTDVWIRSENNDEKKIATLSQGEYWSEDLGKGGDSPGAFYISTSQPVYCMHQSASGSELGGAILPSLYSISGKRITFMKGNKNTTVNSMFLVFRESAKDGFTIDNKRLTVDAKSIGFGDWRYAKVNLTNTTDTLQVCAVANTKGSFSLGYFNGASSTSLYGYFSAFGTFSFASDTIYHCGTSHEFDAPYALSYKWTLPDNTTSDKSVLTATKSGKYTLYVDQDPYKLTDETILCLQNFNHKFYAPSKLLVGKSYNFSIQLNPENDPYNKFNATYEWDFGEGAKVTTDIKKKWVNVYYETAGPKKVALKVTNTNAHCDTTITHEFKVLDTPEVMYWKTDAENQNWNDENNWTDAQGNDLFAVPSAQTKVYLPGPANDARNYPSLNRETDRYFYGDPEVNEIVFG
ncbi:MAG TPA: hypothetical protein DDW85_10310, partial [Porphyromonadaceae bacterium]|nr:hypothetical protein [Porphyromonadaceae bacterium]